MRTYSHALLTGAAARALLGRGAVVPSVVGAALPDAPAAVAAVWLGVRHRRWLGRQEFCERACERGPFGTPDAALHSAVPVLLLLALTAGMRPSGRRAAPRLLLAGWAGHVAADALTHADDARPVLWPVSGLRLRSPVSYWDSSRFALPFAALEHAATLAAAWWLLRAPGTAGAGRR
jgi:hypothetical protein